MLPKFQTLSQTNSTEPSHTLNYPQKKTQNGTDLLNRRDLRQRTTTKGRKNRELL